MQISAQKIEIIMAEHGITASELSGRSGLSRQSISIIKARGTCTPVSAGKIAAGLGVPVTALIAEDSITDKEETT